MSKTRVLYVAQEITPFLPETIVSTISRQLPQAMHEKGMEIRVFMPRYGKINERRHQLHEVIRLSGMNMIINDSDHPLIIKVASIPSARMQVYFIDNEEYFHRKSVLQDDKGKFHKDNDERSIFFVKGVLETVKKLGWAPDLIHCHGWMTAMMPMYLRHYYNEDPHFSDAKVVYSAYEQEFETLDKDLSKKLSFDNIPQDQLDMIKDPTFVNLNKLAISNADGAITLAEGNIDSEITSFINELGKPSLEVQSTDNLVNEVSELYEGVLEGKQLLVEE
ncbi:MAG: glycogen/starch synthase [Flavobacteriales bacterium]|nr:glycogen/starch synthase [Flavobacteriales bacterium]